jgi:hypothetical protein
MAITTTIETAILRDDFMRSLRADNHKIGVLEEER